MRGKTGADREISVNTYTGGFTTMLNHHLRNRNLSLKAVGLLSKMLSLPPDWDYSIRGLATLNTDGIDGIRTAMKELEDEGYGLNYQKVGKELMSQDELAVMDGGKCILQLRGVRPFLSDKFDITKHPKYKFLSDSDKRNAFDIEKYRQHKLVIKPNETFDLYDMGEIEAE